MAARRTFKYFTITFRQNSVSSIYIWSKNLVAESEAKDGGNWRRKKAYGVRIVRQFQSPARKYGYADSVKFLRRGLKPTYYSSFNFRHIWLHFFAWTNDWSSYSRYIWSSLFRYELPMNNTQTPKCLWVKEKKMGNVNTTMPCSAGILVPIGREGWGKSCSKWDLHMGPSSNIHESYIQYSCLPHNSHTEGLKLRTLTSLMPKQANLSIHC